MEDIKITMEKNNGVVDWYVSGKDIAKMKIDVDTAIALHCQLINEKLGYAQPQFENLKKLF